jgi:hypothetical protein
MVKVWNDNVHPYEEKYKGKMVEIPPKDFIEMDYDDAMQFKGEFKAPVINGQGHDPRGFKMIRVERPGTPTAKYNQLTNPVTGRTAQDEKELEDSLKDYAHMRVKDEKAVERQLRENNEAHKAVMSEFKGLLDEVRGELAASRQETADLKSAMGSAPFNLSEDDVKSMVDNKKGGKNANRGSNSKG